MSFPWSRAPTLQRAGHRVAFPNQSRSFDPAHGSVSFWGYASTIEITFQVPGPLLQTLQKDAGSDEASLLRAFDSHRAAIETAARTVYARNRQTFVRLTTADF